MKQNLLTKHCALLLVLAATLWSSSAWALTINVNVTGNQAPYVYAWDNNQTPLIGAFPGTQLTNIKRVGNKTWYYIDVDATSANLILSFGTDETKTGDITGITGNRYFEFANNNANNVTDYYDCPGGFVYETTPFVYLVDTNGWENAYAYVWNGNSNNSWPGDKMECVGTNGNGNKVYKWTNSNLSFTPTDVKFNNVADNGTTVYEEGANKTWVNGAFWSNYNMTYAMTVTGSILNSTNFPDPNLRKAITAHTGIEEGQAIVPDNIKVLDISYDTSKGMTGKITDPTGLEIFTSLEELYSRNNSLSHLDLTHTSTLRILDVSGDNALYGMRGVSYCNASEHGVNVKGNNYFKKLIADDCSAWEYNAGLGTNNSNFQYITSLEYISERNNPLDGWSSGFNYQTGLKYLDLTNSGQKDSELSSTNLNFPSLETLILANNTSVTAPVLTNLTSLKTLNVSSCNISSLDITTNSALEYLFASGNATDPAMTIPNINSLKWIDMSSGNLTYITSFSKLSNLQHLDLHNCPHLSAAQFNSSRVNSTNNPALQYLNISQSGTNAGSKITTFTDDWATIDTLIVQGGNSPVEEIIVNSHMPNVFDVANNTTLTTIAINNCGLTTLPTITATGATSLYKLDLTNNAFTDVPTTGILTLTTLVMNNNQLSDINVSESNIHYLYAQNNNFSSVDYTLPTTSLVGLDLCNNGFTKFKAENNTSLKSLALAGNTNLTEIELHGNTALTQTSPDGEIETDNGLYIKGLSNLKVLNIENSSFSKLGQQNSLQGVTALETLKARHNEFTTFTNGKTTLGAGGNIRIPDETQSSLEDLEGLKYLDLAYNNLQDSVHLYKNVNLKYLDVSHNNEIHGVFDGTITADNTAAQEAMRTKKTKRLVKYGMYYGEKGELTDALYAQACDDQAGRQVRFDIRYEDLNDTTGIYHLDLQKNVNLEWIDISYTNIHNTAAGPGVMNPGWMSKDWVGDSDDALAATIQPNTSDHRSYSAFHTFVYFAPCSKLKTIHMDHCNLQSLGISYFPELDTLTASYMYGDCYFMRDATKTDLRYGMANTGPGRVRKYLSPKTNTETGIQDAVNVVGPDGTANTYYDNNIKYYDISYSGFNELRFNYGINLQHINVSGNPLKFHVNPNSDYSYHNSLDVTYCPNICTVLAENCSDLPIVRAHNRTKLDTLYLSNDPNLKTLYVQNDPVLKDNFVGLNTLTGLETLFGYNNTQWGGIDVASNTALKNLWISNIGARSINIANNANLEKLRAYDNSLTTLDLSENANLLWLDVARNKIQSIDLSGNTNLQFFNISNGSDTRTQLNGTELLNHDGSDGDDIKPTTIFSADETPIANANDGNSLSDLSLPSSIIDARANGNDLHSIKPVQGGSFTNLANIEFAHNHINGIDLSAASGATVESRDNGRTIVADFATFKVKDNNNQIQEYKVYFFQLENLEKPNGTILTDKESKDLKLASRHLGDDGLALNKISGWDSENSGMLKSGTTVTPSNMDDILDPDQIPGKIVVLVPEDVNESTNEASGHATYTYTTGAGSEGSEFYLNWTSNGTVTGLNIVGMPLDNVSVTNTYGNLTVNGADGTVVGVYDLNGRQVASETISGGTLTIDGLAPGIYVVNGVKVVVK